MKDLVNDRQYKAEKAVWLLQVVPFIRFIGLTGSLAYDIAKKNSDIDFFIISKNNRIWTSRYFVIFVLKMFKLYRTGESQKERAGKICPNRFVTDKYLMINPQNRYHAQDYTQLIPMFGEKVYKAFIKKNEWMKTYGYIPQKKVMKSVQSGGVLSAIRKFIEWILSGNFGDNIEESLKKSELAEIKKYYYKNEYASGVYADDNEIRIHPRPR